MFVINRDTAHDRQLELDVSAFEGCRLIEHVQLHTDDLSIMNSFERPDAVLPETNTDTMMKDGKVRAKLRSLSWNVIRLGVAGL